MIARLRGTLLESAFTGCVVEAGGVGYEVLIPLSTFDRLPRSGSEVTLLIHTQVREDAITLYGFATAEERDLFRILINVSGIGGKLALNILSCMPVANFCGAVVRSDLKTLSRINGIGKRTAERLVVELRDKLSAFGPGEPLGVATGSPAAAQANDAALALEQLGFKREAVDQVLKKLLQELPEAECTTENLLRQAIIKLNF